MMPTATQVWLVVEPIDMRAGIDGLNSRPEPVLSNALDPAVHGQPNGQHITVQALLDQLQQQTAETLQLNAALAARDATLAKRDASLLHAEAKIQALTFELASCAASVSAPRAKR